MMISGEHGVLDLAGMGQIANLIGFIVLALAVLGVYRARTLNVLRFCLIIAVVGVAIVISGASLVIGSE